MIFFGVIFGIVKKSYYKPLKKAFLLSNDNETQYFDDKTIAVHATLFLG